jgi:hypothetical protein
VHEPVLINGPNADSSLKPHHNHEDNHTTQSGLLLSKSEDQYNAEEHVIYHVDESYYSIRNSEDLLVRSEFNRTFVPDYILIELPPLLYFPYPAGLVSSSDLSIMVCRSNRSWSEADKGALSTFMKRTRHNPLFLLNGVEMNVVKSAIGEIPEKQSWIRRTMKKKVRI